MPRLREAGTAADAGHRVADAVEMASRSDDDDSIPFMAAAGTVKPCFFSSLVLGPSLTPPSSPNDSESHVPAFPKPWSDTLAH